MDPFQQIEAAFKAKHPKPIYLLMGEESFYIDLLADIAAEHLLDESEKAFNLTILYGKDVDVNTVITEAKRFPMGADRQVIVLKEAQNMADFKLKESLEKWAQYASNPQPTTVLVICYKYGKVDGKTKFMKIMNAQDAVFESKKLYDNQVAAWIEGALRNKGFKVSPKAAAMLGEFLGTDLSKIHNEIEKLAIIVPKGGEITAEVIDKNIGISKDFNNFELTKAMSKKDHKMVLRILQYFEANPNKNPPVVTVSIIYNFISRLMRYATLTDKSRFNAAKSLGMNPYAVDELAEALRNYKAVNLPWAIDFLREGDMKMKGGRGTLSASSFDILKETIFKIMAL
jgi:DNA polymerase III subunit delta